MKRSLYFTFLLAILFLFSTCKENFTTDSSYRLTYSTDSINFDTILSHVLTPTRVVMIYNNTDKDINISECSLSSNDNKFQINLNGKTGKIFHDIDILSGDSLFLFVQFIDKEPKQDEALYLEEYINIIYNGNHEKIILTSYSQDTYIIKDSTITESTSWGNNKPYHIYDSLRIDENVTLTIQPGAKLYFHDAATVLVKGKLLCEGTVDNPITFLGDRKDNIQWGEGKKTSYENINNQWGGIRFSNTSHDNKITYTNIRNGNFGIAIDSSEIAPNHLRLTIGNCRIDNVKQSCLSACNANLYAYNTVFSYGSNGCVVLTGGIYTFNHCTMASYNKSAGFYNYAVYLSDNDEDDLPINAIFNNCIIYGSGKKELYFNYKNITENFQYQFNHCLIQYDIEKDVYDEIMTENHFTEIIWNENPLFLNERAFDFHIDTCSPARNKGFNELYTLYPECLYDKDGKERKVDEQPDLGAYVIFKETEEDD